MLKGIAHICIKSRDLEASRRFYCDGLGCLPAFDFIRNGRRVGFYLKLSDHNFLEFFETGSNCAPPADCAFAHICLEVDSIVVTSARLAAIGVKTSERKLGNDRSYQAWVTDPDGIRIELHEYTPESSQLTGNDCFLN